MFGALLEELAEMMPDGLEWMHEYPKRRSREDCELVQSATGARLRAVGVARNSNLEDMSNAFACTASEEWFRFIDKLVRDSFCSVRATNSMVRIATSKGTIEALSSLWALHGLGLRRRKLFA